MTSTPYPIPREIRETATLVGNGTAGPYGPTTFKVFDIEDVVVWARAEGAERFSDVTATCTIEKTADLALDTVSVTFGDDVPATTDFVIQARRTAERSLAVTKGGTLDTVQIEKELSKIASAISEMRRDLDRALRADIGSPLQVLPPPSAGRYLGWNGSATALENKLLAALGDVEISLDETLSSTSDFVVPAVKTVVAYLLANYQPLDDDLSAIAALTTTVFGRAFLALADEAAFKAAVNLEIGVDVPAFAAAAKLDVEDQALTGGARVTSKDLGTVTSGTLTPDPGDRPMQHYTNNGAHTLAPGTNAGSYLLDITNAASAGAITTSGWTKVVGAAFTTTNGHKFRCACSVGNGGSLLIVQALQ